MIVIDPRKTKVAEMADIWLQIRPGTDGALALGWLNIIINEGLYDKNLLRTGHMVSTNWLSAFSSILRKRLQRLPEFRLIRL